MAKIVFNKDSKKKSLVTQSGQDYPIKNDVVDKGLDKSKSKVKLVDKSVKFKKSFKEQPKKVVKKEQPAKVIQPKKVVETPKTVVKKEQPAKVIQPIAQKPVLSDIEVISKVEFKPKLEKKQKEIVIQPIASKPILSDIEVISKVEFKPKLEKKSKSSYKPLPKEIVEKTVYIDKVVEKIVEKEVFVDKIIEKEIIVDRLVEKPIYIERPIEKLQQIEKPKEDVIHQPKEIVVVTECPFNDGDLIKFKDEIYLVTKFSDGYYIRTSSNGFKKKRIPENWGVFQKI